MAESLIIDQSRTKSERYEELLPQIEALIADESDLVANLANIAAVLKTAFDFFWVGYCKVKRPELVPIYIANKPKRIHYKYTFI